MFRNVTPLFILLLVQVKTVCLLSCYNCSSNNDCQSMEDCEKSCDLKIRKETCADYEQSCLVKSYSYFEKEIQKIVYKFERRCVLTLWGCSAICQVQKFFNSTDCKAKCCKEDLCNYERNSHAGRLTSSGFLTNLSHKFLIFSLLALVVFLTNTY